MPHHSTSHNLFLLQKKLKGAFLKSMQTHADSTSTSNNLLEENGEEDDEQAHATSQKSLDSSSKLRDRDQKSYDCDSEPCVGRDAGGGIEGKLSTAQKLANFAFTHTPVAPS